MIDPAIHLLLAFFVAGLFIVSGVKKFAMPGDFTRSLTGYNILPEFMVPPFARLIPVGEIVLGSAAFFVNQTWGVSARLACAIILLMYGALIFMNIARGNRSFDCGCLSFTARHSELKMAMVLRNIILVAMAGISLLPPLDRIMIWFDYVTVGCGLAVLAMFYIGADLVITNRPLGEA